jgi:MFS family permease
MSSDQIAPPAAAGGAVPDGTGPGATPPRDSVLANHDFVKLWAGESVSLIGTQVTQFTLPLVAVITLDASVIEVGVLNALRFVPVIVLSLFAGVWLDRRRRRPVLIVSALAMAVLIGLIPIASATGHLSIGLLYVVTTLVGALSMLFDVGALSYLPNLVHQRHLGEANSKLEGSTAVAGIGGPGLAGLLVGLITAPITLSVDAVSYLFSAAGLIAIRRPEPDPEPPPPDVSVRQSIAEGMRAVFGSKLLRSLLGQSTALNLFFGVFITVFVVYAVRDLGLSPFELGIVMAAAAVGSLAGALTSTRIRLALGLGRMMLINTVGVSVTLLLLLIPRGSGPAAITILIVGQLVYGASIAMYNVNAITLRQIVTPKRVLARMNATYRMILFGSAPLGMILGGVLGTVTGLRPALTIGLILMASPMLWLFTSPIFKLREMPTGPLDVPLDPPPEQAPADPAELDLLGPDRDGAA